MSVATFSKNELANIIASSIDRPASDSGRMQTKRYCDGMALFSAENADCANFQYPNEGAACFTSEELEAEVKKVIYPDRKRAVTSICAMRYNLFANEGKCFMSLETASYIITLLMPFTREE